MPLTLALDTSWGEVRSKVCVPVLTGERNLIIPQNVTLTRAIHRSHGGSQAKIMSLSGDGKGSTFEEGHTTLDVASREVRPGDTRKNNPSLWVGQDIGMKQALQLALRRCKPWGGSDSGNTGEKHDESAGEALGKEVGVSSEQGETCFWNRRRKTEEKARGGLVTREVEGHSVGLNI